MVTLVELKVLAKKQGLTTSGTKAMIAKRIITLRRKYLTKSQIEMLVPLTKPKKSSVKVVRKQKTKKSKQSPKKKSMNPVEKMLRKLRTFD